MRKILFLDVDGVLNNIGFKYDDYIKPKDDTMYEYMKSMVSYHLVQLLEKAYQECKFDIVISSTWKNAYYEKIIQILKEFGFSGDIIDKTPNLNFEGSVRGNEILLWIKKNAQFCGPYYKYKSYVILDDDTDMLYWQKDNFVHTNSKYGLTEKDVIKIIQIFKNND